MTPARDQAMKSNQDQPAAPLSLRRRAEERLKGQRTGDEGPRTKVETVRLIEELHIHQIEMEMQNEEIKRLQFELEVSKDKYQDIYDVVPVGSVAIYHSDGSMRLLQEMKIWMPPRY